MLSSAAPGNARREWLWVAPAFVVLAFLLTFRLGGRCFWQDEMITVGHIATPHGLQDAFHPPGYYFLLRQWAGIFGRGDLALRAFSVPWGMLALLLTWLLATSLLPRRAATLSVWLCALAPCALLHLRMARYFALTMAAALAAAYFVLLARRYGKPRHYVGLALSAAAVLWLNHVPALLLPLGYLWVLLAAWRRGRERYWWAGAAAFPWLAYAPQVLRALHGAGEVAAASAGAPVSLEGIVLRLVFAFYSVLVGETTGFLRLYIVLPILAAGGVLWGAGWWAVWRSRREGNWPLLLTWPLALTAVVILLSTVAASEPWPRVSSLCLFAAPFFYMVLAFGAERLRRRWSVPLVAVFIAGQAYGALNYLTGREFLNPGYVVPWRQANDLIQAQGSEGDLAIAVIDGTIQRYWTGPVRFDERLARDPTLTPQIRSDLDSVLARGNSVWVIARDRGSHLAKEATDKVVDTLTERSGEPEVHRLLPRTPREQHWYSVAQGRPAEDAYVKIYRFRVRRGPGSQ
jgi:4-amino-4-deoxy-L-arabinose transferase-like glycosyltransferase